MTDASPQGDIPATPCEAVEERVVSPAPEVLSLDFSSPHPIVPTKDLPSPDAATVDETAVEVSVVAREEEEDAPVAPFEESPRSPSNRDTAVRAVVPFHARCEFCQKYDAVCSHCHFRWRNMQQTSQNNLQRTFTTVLDPRERWRIAVSTIACTDHTDWLKLMIESKVIDLDGLGTFIPRPIDATTFPKEPAGVQTTLLHVATAYNRPAMAKLLLESGAYYRKDSRGEMPTAYCNLETPAWSDLWTANPYHIRHTRMKNALALRKEGNFVPAFEIYESVLSEYPTYEHVWCSKGKALIEQKKFAECWSWLDLVEKEKSKIRWVELEVSILAVLRKECQKQYHAHTHSTEKYCLKSCGCVVLDDVTLHIRRLRFPLVRKVFEFMDCEGLYYCSRAMPRCPLWKQACEVPPNRLDTSLLRVLFSPSDAQAKTLHAKLVADFQSEIGKGEMTGSANITVEAAADCYHAYIIRVSVKVNNPNTSPTNNKRGAPPAKVFSKQFNIFRERDDVDWFVSPAGEWETL
jgi:hypothetical protein